MHTNRRASNAGWLCCALSAAALAFALAASVQAAGPSPGAIFTTTVDGTIVNENVRYEAKEDVYLDGGPGPHAPPGAAGLPEGDYYFQVTDPSGQDLLSCDHISCRKVHVNEHGVIDYVYEGTNYVKERGVWVPVPLQHNQGVDVDHSELGAITVQLFEYDDTPNRGGVYKVWITPVEDYAGDDSLPLPCEGQNGPCNVNGENYQPGNYHGFIPSRSKTDNFKVRRNNGGPDPAQLTVRKFHDVNINCVWDAGEAEITGWEIEITDPQGVTNTYYTPVLILVEAGTYTIVEATPEGTSQTVSILDGVTLSCYPDADPTVPVEVSGDNGEEHEVIYGNVGLGSIEACKIYDRDMDGVADPDEPGVAGWQMQLTGTDVTGTPVGPIVQTTGEDGCTTFADLLPGEYTVTELMPSGGNWVPTGPTSVDVLIESYVDGSIVRGTPASVAFTNACFGEADFDTKGYWHNKNGLTELTTGDRDYANGLLPYEAPSSYFDDGDEPFDGSFADGTPVDAAFNDDGDQIWGAGTWQAEISHFLVDSNAGGDPREQLAQQLLAFIFNARHRLGDPGAVIELPDGTMVSAQSLIDEAIAAWASEDVDWQNAVKTLLDTLNNTDAVPFIHFFPCEVVY